MTGNDQTPPGPFEDPAGDRDLEAAEYVMGTLRGLERIRFQEVLSQSPDLRRRVAEWEERLSGLADTVAPVDAPDALWNRIERAIDAVNRPAHTERPSLAARLWSSLALWRATAALATAAACLLAVPALRPVPSQPPETALVAVLQAPEGPAFAVRIPATRRANVTPVGDRPAPPGSSYELWVVPGGRAPLSLGLIERGGVTRVPLDRLPPDLVRQGSVLAISLEPAGGSPTGAPSGPVLFTGTLVEAQ
jgi:anti-sigma-K factor RskA